jgi:PadR family transcriptional regulator PadR
MRTTYALVQVALVLMAEPSDRHWGYDLWKRAGVRSGVLYPMLQRMLDEGWVKDGWEEPGQITDKRPPRRYYTLTERGKAELGALLAGARREVRFRPLFGGVAQ